MEKKRKMIVRSFCIAKDIYVADFDRPSSEDTDVEAGAEFLESSTALSLQQENRLKQVGATVRNTWGYMERAKSNKDREMGARNVMEKMSPEHLSELLSFYHMMEQICSDVLDRKLSTSVHHEKF